MPTNVLFSLLRDRASSACGTRFCEYLSTFRETVTSSNSFSGFFSSWMVAGVCMATDIWRSSCESRSEFCYHQDPWDELRFCSALIFSSVIPFRCTNRLIFCGGTGLSFSSNALSFPSSNFRFSYFRSMIFISASLVFLSNFQAAILRLYCLSAFNQ